MRFADLAVQRMLNTLDESGGAGVGATHISAHQTYSATGAGEISGGSPAFARKALTWAAASGRSKATSAAAVLDIPAGTTLRWLSFWDALTAGNFLGIVPNGGTAPKGFTVDDIATEVLDSPAHGYANGNTVVVWAISGMSLPAPLAEGTVYFVVGATTDTLQLSATSGGAAINVTAVGAGFLQRIVEETFGAQGTHTVSTATMSLD